MRRTWFRMDVTNTMFFVMVVFLLWVFFYVPYPPVENLGGDSVAPATVEQGGVITIYRNFRIVKTEDLTVSRAMVRGDCAKQCVVLDLSTSHLVLKPGDYFNMRRDHQLPDRAESGTWTLRFAWHWTDFFGRQRTLELLPLEIIVTSKGSE